MHEFVSVGVLVQRISGRVYLSSRLLLQEQQRMEKMKTDLIRQVEERDQKLQQALQNVQGVRDEHMI